MEIKEIRRRNLLSLLEDYGQKELGKLTDTPPNYFSQVKNRTRNMGDTVARRVEKMLGKSVGWLDTTHEKNNVVPTDIKGYIPLISWVQAGQWEEAIDLYEPGYAEQVLPTTVPHSLRTFALRVDGDSMTAAPGAPISFPHGMIIYVDPEKRGDVTTGSFVVARQKGANMVTFKQLGSEEGRPVLKPLNTNGQHPIIRDEFEVLGKVIDASWGGL